MLNTYLFSVIIHDDNAILIDRLTKSIVLLLRCSFDSSRRIIFEKHTTNSKQTLDFYCSVVPATNCMEPLDCSLMQMELQQNICAPMTPAIASDIATSVITQILEQVTASYGWEFSLLKPYALSNASFAVFGHSHQAFRKIVSNKRNGSLIELTQNNERKVVAHAMVGGPFGIPSRTARATAYGRLAQERKNSAGTVCSITPKGKKEPTQYFLVRNEYDIDRFLDKFVFAEFRHVHSGRLSWQLMSCVELERTLV